MQQSKKKPISITLPNRAKRDKDVVLALGAELKGNYCILREGKAFLYPGFGDLKRPDCFARFDASVSQSIAKLRRKPRVITHDLNPLFLSSRLAVQLKKTVLASAVLLPVQHHYAHIAGARVCLNLKDKKVIGVACDGTGLGEDRRVWGCEFIVSNTKHYKRMGHLGYIPLPGADYAVTQPWRVAVALLFTVFGERIFSLKLSWLQKRRYETGILAHMIERKVNTPLASSAGRLFDGVAGIIGLCLNQKFEAQAAVKLEELAKKEINKEKGKYPYRIRKESGRYIIDIDEMTLSIVRDVGRKEKRSVIAARFHNTFSDSIITMCRKIRRQTGLVDVILSGGVFFNKIVSEQVEGGLLKSGFAVHRPDPLILGDSGLSLGQAMIAQYK